MKEVSEVYWGLAESVGTQGQRGIGDIRGHLEDPRSCRGCWRGCYWASDGCQGCIGGWKGL